ncbi:MAG: hypothetical protein VB130_03740 [Clostridium sp.]|nr:hypothetical protein [Clostridium sp.]
MLVLIIGLTYKLWWRPKVSKKIIIDKIAQMGGEVIRIEQVSIREEIYNVTYMIEGKEQKNVVKFSFMNEQWWK